MCQALRRRPAQTKVIIHKEAAVQASAFMRPLIVPIKDSIVICIHVQMCIMVLGAGASLSFLHSLTFLYSMSVTPVAWSYRTECSLNIVFFPKILEYS